MLDPSESRYNFDSLCVLIVDDSQFMRNLVESILHLLHIKEVLQSSDAAEAFIVLGRSAVDLVLVDWVMEPLDGLDFIKLVRKRQRQPQSLSADDHADRLYRGLAGQASTRRRRERVLGQAGSAKGLYKKIISVIDHPRPYTRTKAFFGPDRRRKDVGPAKRTPERRSDLLPNNINDPWYYPLVPESGLGRDTR